MSWKAMAEAPKKENETHEELARRGAYIDMNMITRREKVLSRESILTETASLTLRKVQIYTIYSEEMEEAFKTAWRRDKDLTNFSPLLEETRPNYANTFISKVIVDWVPMKRFGISNWENVLFDAKFKNVCEEFFTKEKSNNANSDEFVEKYGNYLIPTFTGGSVLTILKCGEFQKEHHDQVNSALDKSAQNTSKSDYRELSDSEKMIKYENPNSEFKKIKVQTSVFTIPSIEKADTFSEWLDCLRDYPEDWFLLPDVVFKDEGKDIHTFLGEIVNKDNKNWRTNVGEKLSKIKDICKRIGLDEKEKLTMKDAIIIRKMHLYPERISDSVGRFLSALSSYDYRALSNATRIPDDSDDAELEEEQELEEDWHERQSITGQTRQLNFGLHLNDLFFLFLNYCDPFLLKTVITRWSACQLAVPLILPSLTDDLQYLYWGLSGIIKLWRSHDKVQEQQMVKYKGPKVSFVRYGDIRMSKSCVLNKLLGQVQGNDDFAYFMSREQDSSERTCSGGTVEVHWLLPSESKVAKAYTSPVTVLNLRGDASNLPRQTSFLSKISDGMVLFVGDQELHSYRHSIANLEKRVEWTLLVVLTENKHIPTKVFQRRENRREVSISFQNALEVSEIINDELVEANFQTKREWSSLADCLTLAQDSGIRDNDQIHRAAIDEVVSKVLRGAEEDLSAYKKKTLPLQRKYRDWAFLDKYGTRKFKGDRHFQDHIAQTEVRKSLIRDQQNNQEIEEGMLLFFRKLMDLEVNEKLYLIKELEVRSRELSKRGMQAFGDDCMRDKAKPSVNSAVLENAKMFEDMSLGVVYFLREFGQYYESHKAKPTMEEKKVTQEEERININDIPGTLANLMFNGMYLELLDGETNNVPITWITDILKELEIFLGKGNTRVYVISVMGLQSSGKSTLLNCMFGVDFPADSGRCTRGVYMQLVPISECIKEELECDYIILIDTEGLKAPQRELSGREEDDNELATFAMCISSLTLININGQTIDVGIRNILEIVAHAAIRMTSVHLKSECRLVQQFVSDISASEKNKSSTDIVLKKLNEATLAAAREEGKNISRFSDIFTIQEDEETDADLQYIPSLWRGNMSSPNREYSRALTRLKFRILEGIKSTRGTRMTLHQFSLRIKDVWEAIKQEDFVFSFKNTVEVAKYNSFQTQYGALVNEIRTEVVRLQIKSQNDIKSSATKDIKEKKRSLCKDLMEKLGDYDKWIKEKISDYLKDPKSSSDSLRSYEQTIMTGVDLLVNNLRESVIMTIEEEARLALQRPYLRDELSDYKSNWINDIQSTTNSLRQKFKVENKRLRIGEAEIKQAFDVEWAAMIDKARKEEAANVSCTPTFIATQVKSHLMECVFKLKYAKDVKETLVKEPDLLAYSLPLRHDIPSENEPFFDHGKFFIDLDRSNGVSDWQKMLDFINEVKNKVTHASLFPFPKNGVVLFINELRKGLDDTKVQDAEMRARVILHLCSHVMQQYRAELADFLLHTLEKNESKFCKNDYLSKYEICKLFRKAFSDIFKKQFPLVKLKLRGADENLDKLARRLGHLNDKKGKTKVLEQEAQFKVEAVAINRHLREEMNSLDGNYVNEICSRLLTTVRSETEENSPDEFLCFLFVNICIFMVEELELQQREKWKAKITESKDLKQRLLQISHSQDDLEPLFLQVLQKANFRFDVKDRVKKYLKGSTLEKFSTDLPVSNINFVPDSMLLVSISCETIRKYRRMWTIIKTAMTALRDKTSCDYRFSDSVVKHTLYQTLEACQNLEEDSAHTLPTEDIAHILIYVSSLVARCYLRMQKEHDKTFSLRVLLEKEKGQFYKHFKTLCYTDCYNSIIIDQVYQLLRNRFCESVMSNICIEVLEYMNKRYIFFKDRRTFICTVLKDLLQKKSAKQYIEYIQDNSEFLKEWVEHFLAVALVGRKDGNEPAVLDKLVKEHIKKRLQCVKNAIAEVEKRTTGEDFAFRKWFKLFIKCLKSEADIKCRETEVNWLVKYKVVSVKQVLEGLLKMIEEKLISDTLDFLELPNEEAELKQWLDRLPRNLSYQLFVHVKSVCKEKCPFCNARCENVVQGHKTHKVTLHYPRGLKGMHTRNSRSLIIDMCNSSVATHNEFYFPCKCKTYCKHGRRYRDYQKDYPNWHIDATKDGESLKYWKWVFSTFNHQFAEYYGCNAALLPETWKSISDGEALQSLIEAYDLINE